MHVGLDLEVIGSQAEDIFGHTWVICYKQFPSCLLLYASLWCTSITLVTIFSNEPGLASTHSSLSSPPVMVGSLLGLVELHFYGQQNTGALILTRSIWKMLGPFAKCEQPLHCQSPGVAIAIAQAACDVHNDNNDDNDNAWLQPDSRQKGHCCLYTGVSPLLPSVWRCY